MRGVCDVRPAGLSLARNAAAGLAVVVEHSALRRTADGRCGGERVMRAGMASSGGQAQAKEGVERARSMAAAREARRVRDAQVEVVSPDSAKTAVEPTGIRYRNMILFCCSSGETSTRKMYLVDARDPWRQ